MDKTGLLLGKNTPVVDEYSPQLLYPIAREAGRASLGLSGDTAMHGVDLWHAYELSWLDAQGKPVVRVGRFFVPASSPFMVESKSFKLYLNALNSTRFSSDDEVKALIAKDVSAVAGAGVSLELLAVDAVCLSGNRLEGHCLDTQSVVIEDQAPSAALLAVSDVACEESLYSHLLRSLCPVTGQPDWATVWISYQGRTLNRASLLRYIIAFRRHQEFHEQCVERMFNDLQQRFNFPSLTIQAFYTRRGGLDINPMRSTDPLRPPLPRLDRQ